MFNQDIHFPVKFIFFESEQSSNYLESGSITNSTDSVMAEQVNADRQYITRMKNGEKLSLETLKLIKTWAMDFGMA